MSVVKQRKSAFSVYAENEPADENNQTKLFEKNKKQNGHHKNFKNENQKNNKNKNKNKPQNPNHYAGVLKPSKKSNNKIMGEKEIRQKFSKLSNENINQCINMFKDQKKNTLQKDTRQFFKNKHSTPFPNDSKPQVGFSSKILKPVMNHNEEDEDILSEENYEDTEIFDSRAEAINLLKKIIFPVKIKEFFSHYWEKKPMLVKRDNENYNKSWFSCKEFDSILRNHKLEFTTNIDIVTYVNEVKQNHNKEGRAFAPLVWDFFQQGCSIRLLNPGTYSKNCWKYLSTLQELFGTVAGANVYLTPPGTQGFAPHYDDIEAFVLQLEGKKHWRVYKPLSKETQLPSNSSGNFDQKEIGTPIIDCILEPGDLLYFPRGYIHQANACDDVHSLHITVSCYQKNSWGDFLSKLLPGAVEIAMQEDIEYRKGLPVNYLMHNGVSMDCDDVTVDRKNFVDRTTKLVKKLVEYLPIDAAVDQMGKQFIQDSLPPYLNKSDKSRSIHGNGEKWNEEKQRVANVAEIEPDTAIKLIRRNCLRLVVEANTCLIYHNLENGKIYREKEPQFLEVESEAAPAIEYLIKNYPKYCTVDELPISSVDNKVYLASCLYDTGLLVTGEPLETSDTEDEDDYESDDEDNEINNGHEDEYDEGEVDEDSAEELIDESNAELIPSIDNGAEYSDDDDDDDDDDDEDDDEQNENSDDFNSEEYDQDNENEVD